MEMRKKKKKRRRKMKISKSWNTYEFNEQSVFILRLKEVVSLIHFFCAFCFCLTHLRTSFVLLF